ncbi:hypothetical protein TRFO_29742 [Tritrichomonas foetus]|uniref:Leucine Rich Repeat family protein n=1 Tax=Tritrichomonas foetus TaxID=1144522 RepID=A0A1J4JWZ4_9EUKA|nr:hypothetical protein TRFO_29742 [Tritrichomonas foetus]|eukprot:OHT02984.1 hypothetical protein TRFO_29742 [Tritrichomonas foetus]
MKKKIFEIQPTVPQKVIDKVISELSEQERVYCCIVEADLRYNKSLYKKGIFAANIHEVAAFEKSKSSDLKLLCKHNIFETTNLVISKEEEGFWIRAHDTSLAVFCSDGNHNRISRILYRNYYMTFHGIHIREIPNYVTYKSDLFPPLTFNVSPSQEFQFLYFLFCAMSKDGVKTYDPIVVNQIHSFFKASIFTFDFDFYKSYKSAPSIMNAASSLNYFTSFISASESQIESSPMDPLCDFIENCPSLRYVYINNAPKTCNLKRIAEIIKNNPDLKISVWKISGKNNTTANNFGNSELFCRSFQNYRNKIKVLDFSYTGFNGKALSWLFTSIIRNENLQELDELGIAASSPDKLSLKLFSEVLYLVEHTLKKLNISSMKNNIGELIKCVVSHFNLSLKYLNISNNKLSKTNKRMIIDYVNNSQSLKTLDISETGFEIQDISRIFKAIASSSNSNNLILKINELSLGKMTHEIISSAIDNCRDKLSGLEFNANKLDTTGHHLILLSGLEKITNLTNLSLSYNFTPKMKDIGENLANLVLNCKKLIKLEIRGIPHSKFVLKEALLPMINALSRNKSIEYLDITNQYIGNEGIEALSNALRKNSTIKHLFTDGSYINDINIFINFLRVFRSRPMSLTMPFPIRDQKSIISQAVEKEKDEVEIRLKKLEISLSYSLFLHRKNTQYAYLPNIAQRLPNKEVIYEIGQEVDQFDSMKNRNLHTAATEYFNLLYPFQYKGDTSTHLQFETIELTGMDAYQMPNIQKLTKEIFMDDDLDHIEFVESGSDKEENESIKERQIRIKEFNIDNYMTIEDRRLRKALLTHGIDLDNDDDDENDRKNSQKIEEPENFALKTAFIKHEDIESTIDRPRGNKNKKKKNRESDSYSDDDSNDDHSLSNRKKKNKRNSKKKNRYNSDSDSSEQSPKKGTIKKMKPKESDKKNKRRVNKVKNDDSDSDSDPPRKRNKREDTSTYSTSDYDDDYSPKRKKGKKRNVNIEREISDENLKYQKNKRKNIKQKKFSYSSEEFIYSPKANKNTKKLIISSTSEDDEIYDQKKNLKKSSLRKNYQSNSSDSNSYEIPNYNNRKNYKQKSLDSDSDSDDFRFEKKNSKRRIGESENGAFNRNNKKQQQASKRYNRNESSSDDDMKPIIMKKHQIVDVTHSCELVKKSPRKSFQRKKYSPSESSESSDFIPQKRNPPKLSHKKMSDLRFPSSEDENLHRRPPKFQKNFEPESNIESDKYNNCDFKNRKISYRNNNEIDFFNDDDENNYHYKMKNKRNYKSNDNDDDINEQHNYRNKERNYKPKNARNHNYPENSDSENDYQMNKKIRRKFNESESDDMGNDFPHKKK